MTRRCRGVALLALAAVAAGCGSDTIEPDELSGRLAFTGFRDGNAEIYVADLATGVEAPISRSAVGERMVMNTAALVASPTVARVQTSFTSTLAVCEQEVTASTAQRPKADHFIDIPFASSFPPLPFGERNCRAGPFKFRRRSPKRLSDNLNQGRWEQYGFRG